MRFSEFFNEWLYGEDGYYVKFKTIGKEGDFFTAVSVTPLFGGAIANYIYKQIQNGAFSPNLHIFEIGAHKGYLLADIVQFLYTFDPTLIETITFTIVEPFDHLQRVQKEYFRQSFGERVALKHYKSLQEVRQKEAFVVANEIFDAFACELIYKGKMAYIKDFSIYWGEPDKKIIETAAKYHQTKGEVAVGYEEFAKELYNAFEKCEFVTFDYGDLQVRNDFSIRVYTKHRVYPLFDKELDLKKAYKQGDITYDVNFSHLIDAFKEAGWKKGAFATQLVALVDFGIMELLEKILQKGGFEIYKKELEKVKILIAPNQMGERFKMVRFEKR